MRIDKCTGAYDRAMTQSSMTRGALLRQMRDQRGVSQTALANAIGIKTQGTISAWENDKQEIDHDNLLRLADYFRVDPAVLGYVVPRVVDVDEVRAWLEQALAAQEERARVRHEEVLAQLRVLEGIGRAARR